MEQSALWEATGSTVSEEIPCSLWNLKVLWHVHNNTALVSIVNYMNPFSAILSFCFKLHYDVTLPFNLGLRMLNSLFSLDFPTKIPCEFLFFPLPMHVAWPAHLIFLGLNLLIIFGKDYKSWTSSLCSFLQPTASILGPNIFLSTLLYWYNSLAVLILLIHAPLTLICNSQEGTNL
jgi:hypothetical protein